jgi:hypothetical protein
MWICNKFFKNKIQEKIDREVKLRKSEIEIAAQKEVETSLGQYQLKVLELDNFKQKAENELSDLKSIRERANQEQKEIWEKLNILRDNLNTQDVWVKLWECAYSKAVDAVWSILQRETLHLVDLAEQRAYIKAKEEFDADLKQRIDNLINTSNEKDAIPFVKLLALKKKIEDVKLNSERIKNSAQIEKSSAQLEVLEGLL